MYPGLEDTMLADVFLLADLGDWIALIVFVVMGLGGLLNQISQQVRQDAPAKPRPGKGPGESTTRSPADELRDFLQQISQQDQDEPEADVLDAELVPPQQDATPSPAEYVPRTLSSRHNSVAEHVEQHLGTDDHLPHRKSILSSVDEQMESHLHDVFDHKLGGLAGSERPAILEGTDSQVWTHDEADDPYAIKASRSTQAHALIQKLQESSGARDAVILAEILGRPDF